MQPTGRDTPADNVKMADGYAPKQTLTPNYKPGQERCQAAAQRVGGGSSGMFKDTDGKSGVNVDCIHTK